MFDSSKEILRDNIEEFLQTHTESELMELVLDVIKGYWGANP